MLSSPRYPTEAGDADGGSSERSTDCLPVTLARWDRMWRCRTPTRGLLIVDMLRIASHFTVMEFNLPAHDIGPLTILTCPIGAVLQIAFDLIQSGQPFPLADLRRGVLTLRA